MTGRALLKWQGRLVVSLFGVLALHGWTQQERPTNGLLHDPDQASSLSYGCTPIGNGELQCILFQSTVRKRVTEESLAADIARARANYKPERSDQALCAKSREDLDILDGRKTPPPDHYLASLRPEQRREMRDVTLAWIDYCNTPNVDTYVRTIEVERAKPLRTCTIRQTTYVQTFRWVKGSTPQTGTWIARQKPETDNSCGYVDLSRFETYRKPGAKSTSWKFVSRSEVANPKGTTESGMPCYLLYSSEYNFSGEQHSFPMQCEFILFD